MKNFLESSFCKNLKRKMKNYGFWLSLVSAVVVMLQSMGISIDNEVATNVVSSICGVFVVLGIISNPTSGKGYLDKVDKENLSKTEEE